MIEVTIQIMGKFLLQSFEFIGSIRQIAFKFGHFLQTLQHLLSLLVIFEIGFLYHRFEIGIVGIRNFEILRNRNCRMLQTIFGSIIEYQIIIYQIE